MRVFKKVFIILIITNVIFLRICTWSGKLSEFETLILNHIYTLFIINYMIFSDISDIRDSLQNFKTNYMMVDMKAIKKAEEDAEEK